MSSVTMDYLRGGPLHNSFLPEPRVARLEKLKSTLFNNSNFGNLFIGEAFEARSNYHWSDGSGAQGHWGTVSLLSSVTCIGILLDKNDEIGVLKRWVVQGFPPFQSLLDRIRQ